MNASISIMYNNLASFHLPKDPTRDLLARGISREYHDMPGIGVMAYQLPGPIQGCLLLDNTSVLGQQFGTEARSGFVIGCYTHSLH